MGWIQRLGPERRILYRYNVLLRGDAKLIIASHKMDA